jgi:NADH-quinone oxidoreductase subunit F
LETSRPRFYAGGDLVTGASNVSNAMASGKQAARSIDLQLMETDRWNTIVPQIEFGRAARRSPAQTSAIPVTLSPPMRASVSQRRSGHRPERTTTLDETCRCLRCDVKAANVS